MNAKEMFESLGYKYSHFENGFKLGEYYTNEYIICSKPLKDFIKRIHIIMFSFNDKSVSNYICDELGSDEKCMPIYAEELKAINQQCKELGWLD